MTKYWCYTFVIILSPVIAFVSCTARLNLTNNLNTAFMGIKGQAA